MRDIAAAFREAFETEQRWKDRHPSGPRPSLATSTLNEAQRERGAEVHCFEPWIIINYLTGQERRAEKSLVQDGFEVFYPAGRKVGYLPQNQIPPKKRHRKGYFLRIDLRLPYPGYMFVRRLVPQSTGLRDLWKLDGVAGVCMFGEEFALLPDFRVEMMRMHQDAGDYDDFDASISAKVWRLAEIRVTDAAKGRWENPPRSLGKLDTNHGAIHFIEEFGRITRVITSTGDQYIAR